MKKFICFLLVLVMLALMVSCGSKPEIIEPTVSDTVQTTDESDDGYIKSVCVGIAVGEDGYYSLMGDVKIETFNGEVADIIVKNPALLAFQVSERMDYGVYVFKLAEGDYMIETIAEVVQKLEASGNKELADEMQKILDRFTEAGPIISAST